VFVLQACQSLNERGQAGRSERHSGRPEHIVLGCGKMGSAAVTKSCGLSLLHRASRDPRVHQACRPKEMARVRNAPPVLATVNGGQQNTRGGKSGELSRLCLRPEPRSRVRSHAHCRRTAGFGLLPACAFHKRAPQICCFRLVHEVRFEPQRTRPLAHTADQTAFDVLIRCTTCGKYDNRRQITPPARGCVGSSFPGSRQR